MIELLGKEFPGPSEELMQALAYFKDPTAAEAVAKGLGDIFDETHSMCAAALRAMGPAAEDALIKVAPSNNAKASLAAIELLGDVGTRKSLSLLKRAARSRNPAVRDAAALAEKKIRERMAAEESE